LTHVFWAAIFGWMGIHIPRAVTPFLSFAVFLIMVIIGTRTRLAGRFLPTSAHQDRESISFFRWVGWFVVITVSPVLMVYAVPPSMLGILTRTFGLVLFLLPLFLFSLFSRNKIQCTLLSLLYTFFWFVLLFLPERGPSEEPLSVGLERGLLLAFLPIWSIGFLSLVAFTPLRALNVRLTFLLCGAIILV